MNATQPRTWLDTRWARRSFDRAGASYDAAAVLQREVRGILLQRLELMDIKPRMVVDAGAGTGHASRFLAGRYPKARVIAVDSAFGMLRQARRQRSWLRRFGRVCADAGQMPFADASVDLILSNLMLQWCDPDLIFPEFRRVLAPNGLLSFSSFGPDTLRELRSAWSCVDGHEHVNRFVDMHDVGDALIRAGFAAPVLDVDRHTLEYSSVRELMADLKAIGAHNAAAHRPRGLTSPRRLNSMLEAYEQFRRGGRLPATYEVVFGHAWAPKSAEQPSSEDAAISLQELRAILRRSAAQPRRQS